MKTDIHAIVGRSVRRRAVSIKWGVFKKRPGAFASGLFLMLLVLVAVAAPLIAPYAPNEQDILNAFAPMSAEHWLGTDQFGRDTLSRIMYGARMSLAIAGLVIALTLTIALPIGLVSGYRSGITDQIVMRLSDAALSIPGMILALAIAGVMGPGFLTTVIALTVFLVPHMIRFVRAETLRIAKATFVEASIVGASRTTRILFRRIVPNLASPLIAYLTLVFGDVMLAEAALSYLGAGVQPPTSSWGNMLELAFQGALFSSPIQLVIPGAAIAFAILAFNTLGDALAEALGTGRNARGSNARPSRGITRVAAPQLDPGSLTEHAENKPDSPLLDIRGLRVTMSGPNGDLEVLDGVDLKIARGEIVGLVGESGSGKSVTSLSIMRLLPSPPATIAGGSILLDGEDLLRKSRSQMAGIRGARIAMIFQDPMTALDPSFRIGDQLVEAYRINHPRAGRAAARQRAIELLAQVQIPEPAARMRAFPHELSGGMRQRVMLAMALTGDPDLLIADEPTTALDVTVQAQIIALIRGLQKQSGVSVLFVTHDLGVVAELCDRAVVMYAGQIVEDASVLDLFDQPRHPYTEALLDAMPNVDRHRERMAVIPGTIPAMDALPPGCRFAPRCVYATDVCHQVVPQLRTAPAGEGASRCIRSQELVLTGVKA